MAQTAHSIISKANRITDNGCRSKLFLSDNNLICITLEYTQITTEDTTAQKKPQFSVK